MDREAERHIRQEALPEVGRAGQDRIRRGRVLVVGLGGLGSPAALYLAGAGVGRLGLCDPDLVEPSNLHRQPLYAAADVGRPKVEAAADRLRALDPAVALLLHPVRLDAANAGALVSGYDVVVDGTDDLAAKDVLNDACAAARIPLVHGAAVGWEGSVAVFDAARGPCYRCLFARLPQEGASCARDGVLGPVPGVIGSLQAQEALKLLVGAGTPLAGRLLLFDGRDGSTRTLRFKRDPRCGRHVPAACPLPWNAPTVPSIAAADFEARRPEFFVLDVREPDEFEEGSIPGSTLIPLGELAARLGELPRGRPILCLCAVGGRSARATRLLLDHGFEAMNLRGGIQAWMAVA